MTLGQKSLKKVHSPIKSPKLANSSLRKKALLKTLSNGVQFGAASKANLKVVVRIRPDSQREIDSNARSVIDIVDDHMLIFDPDHDEGDFFFKGTKQKYRDLNKRPHKEQKFVFERVFGPSSTNEEIFETTTKDIVNTILEGYNCSVFAYGATGSGKTHTMIGGEHRPGIAFLTVMELYSQIEKLRDTRTCEVGVSYLEVYNEMVRDLLIPSSPPLNLREIGQHMQVTGLSFHKPADAQDLLRILAEGNRNRSQHPTDANAESSRSHAVFQVFVRQQERASDIKSSVSIAKLSMIDLAGSERGAVTGFRGARFREGANINKSLLALGNCINALADGKGHIPYRDSKLTRLLKDSIGGNCRSVMIATICKTSLTFEDTFNTLRYANRAKTIKTTLKKNMMNVDQHVSQYLKVVEDLKGEISVLKELLKMYEGEAAKAPEASTALQISDEERKMYEETIRTLRVQLKEEKSMRELKNRVEKEFLDDLMDLNCQHKNSQREILQLETTERELNMKIYLNRVYMVRMTVFAFASTKLDKGIAKCERSIHSFESHLEHIHRRKKFLNVKLTETKRDIFVLCDQFKKSVTSDLGESSELLINKLRQNELEQNLRDEHQINEYLRSLVASLVADQFKTEKLLALLLIALKHTFLRQKVAKECDPDTNDFLENIFGMLDTSRIEWADLKDTEESFGEQTVSQHVSLVPMMDIGKLTNFPALQSLDFSPAVSDIATMYKRSSIRKTYPPVQLMVCKGPDAANSPSCMGATPERPFNSVSLRRLFTLSNDCVKEAEAVVGYCPSGPPSPDNRHLGILREADYDSEGVGPFTALCGVTPPATLGTPQPPRTSSGKSGLPEGGSAIPVPFEDTGCYPLDITVTIDSNNPTDTSSELPSPAGEKPFHPTSVVLRNVETTAFPDVFVPGTPLPPTPPTSTIAKSLPAIVESVHSEMNQTMTLSDGGSSLLCHPPFASSLPGSEPTLIHDVANSTFSVTAPEAMETFIIPPDDSDVRNCKVVLQPLSSSVVKNRENLPAYKTKNGSSLSSSKYSFSKLPSSSFRQTSTKSFSRSFSTSSLSNAFTSKNALTNSHSKGAIKKSANFFKPRIGSTTKNKENAPKTVGSTTCLNPQKELGSKRTLHFNSSTSTPGEQ